MHFKKKRPACAWLLLEALTPKATALAIVLHNGCSDLIVAVAAQMCSPEVALLTGTPALVRAAMRGVVRLWWVRWWRRRCLRCKLGGAHSPQAHHTCTAARARAGVPVRKVVLLACAANRCSNGRSGHYRVMQCCRSAHGGAAGGRGKIGWCAWRRYCCSGNEEAQGGGGAAGCRALCSG